jgi:lipoprotein NlpD
VKAEPKGLKVAYSEQALAQLTRDPGKAPAVDPKPAADSTAQARPAPSPTPTPVIAKPAPVAPPATTAAVKPASPPSAPVVASNTKPEAIDGDGLPQWVWPTAGKLLHPFNQGTNPKGVAIGGTAGQPVIASAAGKVVYSGSGLRGYGKLIIIKHNSTYLSVYAHNRELLVKEGERVSRGQKIAEMGSTDAERVSLHFEIRRLGKPVDPFKYLPPEGA